MITKMLRFTFQNFYPGFWAPHHFYNLVGFAYLNTYMTELAQWFLDNDNLQRSAISVFGSVKQLLVFCHWLVKRNSMLVRKMLM